MKKLLSVLVIMMFLFTSLETDAAGPSGDSQLIKIGSAKQLFIDDMFFATSKNISLKVNPAQKSGQKILHANRNLLSLTPGQQGCYAT